jgi:hypothetical protein
MTYISNISQIAQISKYFFKHFSQARTRKSILFAARVRAPSRRGTDFFSRSIPTSGTERNLFRAVGASRSFSHSNGPIPWFQVRIQKRITDKFTFYVSHIIFIHPAFVNREFLLHPGKKIFYPSEIHLFFSSSSHERKEKRHNTWIDAPKGISAALSRLQSDREISIISRTRSPSPRFRSSLPADARKRQTR